MKLPIALFLVFSVSAMSAQSMDKSLLGIVGGLSEQSQLTYSIGETLILTHEASGYQVESGLLHTSLNKNLKSKTENLDLSLSPNPTTSDVITIDMNDTGQFTYQIHNHLGQHVAEDKFSGSRKTIDVSSFSAGAYRLVVLRQEGLPLSTTFIKL